MWSTIASLGGGLLLGLGLMIWGLVERSKRAKVELQLSDVRNTCTGLRKDLLTAAGTLERLSEDKGRVEAQVSILRKTVDELRTKLVECRDPATVRSWLDEELAKQV